MQIRPTAFTIGLIIYSFIALFFVYTEFGIDSYFELLLTVLSSMAFLTNPDILEELLPWNESVQKICKAL